jgi:indole-3-glycerol phosphate synthase
LDDNRIIPEVQAPNRTWTPPGGTLGAILAEARERVRSLPSARRSELQLIAAGPRDGNVPSFTAALRAGRAVSVIAEVKRRSPSKGEINTALSAGAQAMAYAAGGAAAISVLTEPQHFGGSLTDLADARAAVSIPLLRKDFVLDRTQLWEARAAGASAVLLIARALEPALLDELAAEAIALGLEPFVEVRSEQELARALATGAPAIGVNQRDLETLAIDPEVAERLLPLVPRARVAVSESGVRDRGGVERAAANGADAVLVGSALSAAADPAAAVRALTGVARGAARSSGHAR